AAGTTATTSATTIATSRRLNPVNCTSISNSPARPPSSLVRCQSPQACGGRRVDAAVRAQRHAVLLAGLVDAEIAPPNVAGHQLRITFERVAVTAAARRPHHHAIAGPHDHPLVLADVRGTVFESGRNSSSPALPLSRTPAPPLPR